MSLQNKFKELIYQGEIEMPANNSELTTLLERYAIVSNFKGDICAQMEDFKALILLAHKQKSMGKAGCYISAIKTRTSGISNTKLKVAVRALYDVDLMTHSIQRLVADGKIKVNGKKIYLISETQ